MARSKPRTPRLAKTRSTSRPAARRAAPKAALAKAQRRRRLARRKRQAPRQALPATFQGRPITMVTWRGQRCAAVEGLVVRKRRTAARDAIAGASSVTSPGLRSLGLSLVAVPALERTSSRAAIARAVADAQVDGVEWAEPVLIDRISGMPSDPLVSEQWGLTAIEGEAAFDVATDTSGVLLAVLDSGLPIESGQQSHQELQGDRFVFGRDVVSSDDDPADDHGHGTHVLGIAAATAGNSSGVAGLWAGNVVVIKVFDSLGAGSSVAFAEGVTAAVEFAKARNQRLVINYSGGGPDSETKKTAMDFARDNGALLLAAAGNDFGSPIDFPAAYSPTHDNVVAVGAVDRHNALASFCNVGPEMNIVAPGVDIISTLPNYFVTVNAEGKQTKFDRMDGTSQATPYVSAVAALIWSRQPGLSAAQVRQKLLSAAVALPDANVGDGMLNARKALS